MPKLRNVGTNMRTAVKIALGSADVFNNEGYLSIFETPLLQVRERCYYFVSSVGCQSCLG